MNTVPARGVAIYSAALLLTLSGFFAASAGSQTSPQSTPQPRIIRPINQSSMVTLRGNTHPLALPKYDQGPAPASMPASRLVLVLARSQQQEADLQTWLQSLQDAHSPNYHKFLSPEDFGNRFGAADTDIQSITNWLTGSGFAVSKVSKSRMAIEFSGSVGQVERAFHTPIHSYLISGVQHWANAADPQIPSALSPVVAGLTSLSSFRPRAQYTLGPRGIFDKQQNRILPDYTNSDPYGDFYFYLGPADAATIYDTPTTLNANLSGTAYDGTGVTIGVAGDSNIDVILNAEYRSTFGLAANPTTVVVDGADPGENGDAIEAYLDTQVSGGIAPNANVILYTAAGTVLQQGLFLAMQRAIDDNQADILNVSFGECESALGASGNQFVQNLWEQAAAQGISVIVSAGDSGSAGCDDPDSQDIAYLGLAVNGLASTPYNVAVGGTDFDVLYSNFPSSFTEYVNTTNTLPNHRSALQYIPEEPWNDSTYPNTDISANIALNQDLSSPDGDDIIATGGGMSTLYAVPSWQSGFASGGNRNLPDVSILAGNGFYGALWSICTDQTVNGFADCAAGNTGTQLYLTGIGGTSASAPALAGMLALARQMTGSRLGQADYLLYDMAKTSYSTVFHDVTVGDNSVSCEITNGGCSEVAAGYYFMNGYNAAAGYDMASGLGSVDASQMVIHWPSPGLIDSTSTLQLNGATTPVSITHGQSVQVNATVSGGGTTPTGVIALVDNLSPALLPNREGIADFTLANGAVSSTTTFLPGGSYAVSAHYGGSSTIAESDSNAISVTVAPETSTTTITSVTFTDPATGMPAKTAYYGFNAFIDAQPFGNSASAAKPDGAATGAITFMNGSTTLGTGSLNAQGTAEIQTSLLPGGADTLTASFPGDNSFKASNSAPYPITILPAITNIAASLNYLNSPFSVSANLTTDSAGVAPTGTVTIMNGATVVGTAPMMGTAGTPTSSAGGTANFTPPSLSAGSYNLTAVYGGDTNYAPSTSAPVPLIIRSIQVSMVVMPPNGLTPINQPVQVTIDLYPAESGGPAPPSGTITLSFNGQTLPAATVSNSAASFTIPANTLPVGTTVVTATYSGDQYYSSSSSTNYVNMRNIGTIPPMITVSAPAGTVNYPVPVFVNISGPGGSPTPTGSVSLINQTNYGASAPLVHGTASFTISNGLAVGPNMLNAFYIGDSNYTDGTGAGSVSLAVQPVAPVIQFSPLNPTIVANQALNLTVTTIGSIYLGLATGTVTLSSGAYMSSPVALSAGSASFTIPANTLAVGNDTVTASYSGDSQYLAASGTEPVTVTAPPPPSFAIVGTALTLAPGAATGNTSTITVTPSGGFTGSVALTAALTSSPTGAADLPTFSFGTTTPVSITGASAGTATLTITTTPQSTSALLYPKRPGFMRFAAGGSALACVLLFCTPRRKRNWRKILGMLLLLVGLTGGVFACGGGGSNSGGGGGGGGQSNPGTTPGTYTITVTGTGPAGTGISATGTITLTVQ